MKKLLITLSLFLCLCDQTVYALDLIENNYSFEKNIFMFKDTSSNSSFEKISSTEYSSRFEKLNVQNRIMDEPSSVYWLKISISDKTKNNNWLIEFFDFRISSLVLYNENGQKIDSVSHYALFKNRAMMHKNFVFPLRLKENETTVYYVKIIVDKESYISGAVRTFENFN